MFVFRMVTILVQKNHQRAFLKSLILSGYAHHANLKDCYNCYELILLPDVNHIRKVFNASFQL